MLRVIYKSRELRKQRYPISPVTSTNNLAENLHVTWKRQT